jgi:hypothetical protein
MQIFVDTLYLSFSAISPKPEENVYIYMSIYISVLYFAPGPG